MSLANAGNISKQLPSVLTLLDSAFSQKSTKKSRLAISTDSPLSKEAFRKTFMFTSDLIFGRLGEDFSRKENFNLGPSSDLKPAVAPVKSKPEKGLGQDDQVKNSLARDVPLATNPKKPRLDVKERKEMKRLPDENIAYNIRRVPANNTAVLYSNDQQQIINKVMTKSDSVEELDNRSDNAKNFTIERLLGKEGQHGLLGSNTVDVMVRNGPTSTIESVRVKAEPISPNGKTEENSSVKSEVEDCDQGIKLPNISQFFEPVDSMEFQRSTVSKCDIGTGKKKDGPTFTWLNGESTPCSFPTPLMVKDFPLLRNTGRIEFNRGTTSIMQQQDEAPNPPADQKPTLKQEKEEEMQSSVEELKDKPKTSSRPIKKKEPQSDGEDSSTQPLQTRQQQQVSGNKGFRCEKCGKIYCRKYVLKIHMRTHSGEKPLKCQVCGKSFSDPSNMKKHVKLHETDHVTYPCKFCGRNFVRRRGLLNHLHSMHSRFPFVHPQI